MSRFQLSMIKKIIFILYILAAAACQQQRQDQCHPHGFLHVFSPLSGSAARTHTLQAAHPKSSLYIYKVSYQAEKFHADFNFFRLFTQKCGQKKKAHALRRGPALFCADFSAVAPGPAIAQEHQIIHVLHQEHIQKAHVSHLLSVWSWMIITVLPRSRKSLFAHFS